MKKLFALLLAVIMCLSLAACGSNSSSGNIDSGSSNDKTDSTAAVSSPDSAEKNDENEPVTIKDDENELVENEPVTIKDDENELVITKDGVPGINGRRFPELVETVELTTENWADYIDFYFSVFNQEEKDAFGEVVSTMVVTSRFITAKTDKCFQIIGTEEKPAAIELKHKTTGEELTVWLEGLDIMFSIDTHIDVAESFIEENSIDNYDCTRIQGTLYIVDIPEEVILDNGDPMVGKEFYVYYPNGESGYGGIRGTRGVIHMVSVADILDNCN